MPVFSIAIDGPVGVGKSSVADEIAERLGVLHLDTGAMYRAFALCAVRRGVDICDEAAVCAMIDDIDIGVRFEHGRQRTLAFGEDVTDIIRTPELSMAASTVSRYAAVRARMVKEQREIAKSRSMVLDGRDIGTVVLKDATLKVFLTAAPEERARRRCLELRDKGAEAPYEKVLADVIARDLQDTTRQADPLRAAVDAVTLDTTNISKERVTEMILDMLEKRICKA